MIAETIIGAVGKVLDKVAPAARDALASKDDNLPWKIGYAQASHKDGRLQLSQPLHTTALRSAPNRINYKREGKVYAYFCAVAV